MGRYRWNILGLCKIRWKNFGETTTEEGHKIFFSGKEDKHKHDIGFLVHKDIVNTVMEWKLCEHCHGMSPSLQRAYHYPPKGSPFQHHNSTSVHPNVIPWWLWAATECHWSDAEGHSCCARRLECKSWQGCLWKLARHLWIFLQWWHRWERTQDFWSLLPLTILCWQTLLVITKHPEDGHGTVQMDNTTTRLITL